MNTKEIKKAKRLAFKGISLEQKWKKRNNEDEPISGNKSGGFFMRTTIEYRG